MLCPFPVACHFWSHLSLVFVSGLPASEGNTVVFTIVDYISRFVSFVPLPKLPSTKETADLFVQEVLWSMVFLTTWYSTMDPSLLPLSERPSVWPSAPPSVCLWGFTHRPTAKQNVPTRSWNPPSAVWCLPILHPGLIS